MVRCGPATVAPAAPAPRPSLLSQFFVCSLGHWPCSCSQSGPSPYLPGRGQGLWAPGVRALPPGHTVHWRLSLGCGVCSVFHVWGRLYFGAWSLARASLGHTPCAQGVTRGMEGSRCERLSVHRFGCCHRPWQRTRFMRVGGGGPFGSGPHPPPKKILTPKVG